MRKLLFVVAILLLVLMGCKSKEEKAAELIKTEMSKTLYDFDSYSPIETTVTEAKRSAYTDTTIWEMAELSRYAFNSLTETMDELNKAQEHMDIWGPPTYYSSTYSDNQYYKYKKEYDEKKELFFTKIEVVKGLINSLKDSINNLDTATVVGWEVNHRFRCKTKGGMSTIGDYRYVIDKDFKNILIKEDRDDKGKESTSSLITSVLKGEFDDAFE